MARTPKDPRHRAREAALQILYQWDIGGRAVDKSADTFFTRQWPDVDEAPDELRAFATRLAVDTVDRMADIDPLIAETAERWRPERMAVPDRLLLRMAGCGKPPDPDAPGAAAPNKPLQLPRYYPPE